MFLYISKAFDWVWHGDLIYKLRVVGICGGYDNLIQSFFNNSHQRVILNSHHEKDL